jgi:LuxR family maltose regulon positive regulatory protein
MTVAEVPLDLLEVKLAGPSPRSGMVPKVAVIEQLRTTTVPLATVVAPAGYGKTTLLAQWAEADPRPFAWVVVDGRDDDPVVLLRYIAAAIHQIEPLSSDVFDALSGPGASWTGSIGRVGKSLATLDRPLVLVLDDLHAVANPSCLDVIAELFQYVPAGSLIAISSREDPALPLARWRAQGSIDEISVKELGLDDHEAGLLLTAAGVDLEEGEVAQLNARTEGWPAGLYLAALSIKAGGANSGTESITGDDLFVSEYFRLELLSRLPTADAHFLTHTSVLERMSGGLCDSVLQTTGSTEALETLAHTNGFVVHLDRRGEWYRYHHLFGELLRNELERSDPDIVRDLNRRAMAWCIDNDLAEAAVLYGHAAGETEAVAGLVDALVLPLYYDGRRETAEEWLSWFSQDELVKYPALAVFGAWLHVLAGRPEEAERWLALAEGATSAIPLSDGSATIEPWVATLRANMMPDGVERALSDANLALDQLPTESGWVPVTLVIRGIVHTLLGASDRANADLIAAVETGLAAGAFEDVYVAQAELSLIAARNGQWKAAGQRAEEAQALVAEAGLADYSTSAIVHVAMARVAVHEARKEDAAAALARAHRLRPLLDHGIPWLTIQVGLELTRAHLSFADAGAARTVLSETEAVLELRPDMGSLVDDARELHERVAATTGSAGSWAMSLTGAELRLLPYLATHLTFPEIATRLFISRNTAKTEAVSIYRKLSASSRSEAIERAVEVGLLESSIPSPANLTQDV